MSGRHFDYDVLADLAEGLLDEQTTTSVRAHLEECAECSDRSADLVSVSHILAAAPLPPLPESLAARLDAALLAQAPDAPVIDLAARRRMRMHRILAAAAAVTVVSGVGAALANGALDIGSSGTPAAITAPRHTPKPLVSSHNRLPLISSGTRYTTESLVPQVQDRLRESSSTVQDGTVPSRLLECVKAVAGGSAPVVLVDDAWFDGRQATVIVVSGTSGGRHAYVVGPQCSAEEQDLFASVQLPA